MSHTKIVSTRKWFVLVFHFLRHLSINFDTFGTLVAYVDIVFSKTVIYITLHILNKFSATTFAFLLYFWNKLSINILRCGIHEHAKIKRHTIISLLTISQMA